MKRLSFIILFFGCLYFSCQKKNQQSAANNPVPNVNVNFTLYPNDPLYFKIQSVGGWMYMNDVGINGIIIYRKNLEEFLAIERTSSYLPDNASAKVFVMNDNFILRDTISDSRWRINDANVSQGPAVWPLRTYATNYSNGALRITN